MDSIQIALIGAGGMGMGDTRYAVSLPGVKLVAVCDVYDGRLARAKELWGRELFTTRDYREVLARKDVDAVIVATPDHWHQRITVEALNAGKDVYCEKPMVHSIDEGAAMIEAQQRTGRTLQIGSQYVSSLMYQKAKELLAAGAIGQLNMVEAWLDRNTAIGAWQYSIPPDASPSAAHLSVPLNRFECSAGETIGTMEQASPAICSSTCSPACTSPPAPRVPRACSRQVVCVSGKTGAMCRM